MRSQCRFELSRKILSLYSSEIASDGVKVVPPRRGVASPGNSRGYAPSAGPRRASAAGGKGPAFGARWGACWHRPSEAVAHMVMPTVDCPHTLAHVAMNPE